MNYRHAFHAGSFADVLKHATLCRVLLHLRHKPAAFCVIDTHAGAGLYDLSGAEGSRGGEWRRGIARLCDATLPGNAAALLTPYLDTVAAFNATAAGRPLVQAALAHYPGSPLIARAWLRPQDRLVACEQETGAADALGRQLRGDRRCKVLRQDGWLALRTQLPPKERRGLVLIDPAFEQADEFATLLNDVAAAHRKWPSGIFLLWYPVKDRHGPDLLAKGLRRLAIGNMLRIELFNGSRDASRLARCGVIVVNPPWTLENDLSIMLPALAKSLSSDRPGGFRLDWLTHEN